MCLQPCVEPRFQKFLPLVWAWHVDAVVSTTVMPVQCVGQYCESQTVHAFVQPNDPAVVETWAANFQSNLSSRANFVIVLNPV